MPNDPVLAMKPFRIGMPTLPGRNGDAIDPYAERAIEKVGARLAKIKWLDEAAAVAQPQIVDVNNKQEWVDNFVLRRLDDPFNERGGHQNCQDSSSLETLLEKEGHTGLIHQVRQLVAAGHRPINTQALMANDDLFLYSFAHALYRLGIKDAEGIAAQLVDPERGAVDRLYRWVALEAIKDYVATNKVEVDDLAAFERAAKDEVAANKVAFAAGAFESYLKRFADDYAYRRDDLGRIRRVSRNLGLNITADEESYLARYFGSGVVALTAGNAQSVIPPVLTQYRSTTTSSVISPSSDAGPLDFGVKYYAESFDTAAINTENVQCAAQLFYVMTLGDELGVFRASDLLVTRKLGARQVDVKAPQLLSDLQDYAFNGEFRYGSGNRAHQRTSLEERQMFYRQVFDLGETTLLDGMVTNTDFTALWSSLMVETVRYIEKVERSEQPESYVSRNGIAQVMSDLQYNLSTYASGMAKVMTPIMYRELDFLIERIWKSPEIVQQLAPHNTGSFWRAIEAVLQEDQGRSVGLTALLKKAEYGHTILSAIADFSPATTVADDAAWTQLVSTIEAFIITSEQVGDDSAAERGYRQPARVGGDTSGLNGVGPVDDWAF